MDMESHQEIREENINKTVMDIIIEKITMIIKNQWRRSNSSSPIIIMVNQISFLRKIYIEIIKTKRIIILMGITRTEAMLKIFDLKTIKGT